MTIIPYAVDVPYDRRPFTNWVLVGSVIAAFAMQMVTASEGNIEAIKPYILDGWGARGLFGHMWLHGGYFHLGGNMLFLWVFGNAVCAKVGNLKFLPIYLLLGFLAAATHLVFDGGPAIGASGAINGVVGMFLIFFWENEVDCLWIWFPIIRTFSISSFWLIGLWLLYDIAGAVLGGGHVAYYAHLGGFFAGIAAAIILVKLNLVTIYRDEETLVERFEGWLQDRRDAKLQDEALAAVEKAQQQTPPSVQPRSVPAAPAEHVMDENLLSVIRFRCPCGKVIKTPGKYAGKTGRCPQCKRQLIVPTPASAD